MVNLQIQVTPFAIENGRYTRLFFKEGDWTIEKNSRLYSYICLHPIRCWMYPYQDRIFNWKGFLPNIVKELNDSSYRFEFIGTIDDYNYFKREIEHQSMWNQFCNDRFEVLYKKHIQILELSIKMKKIIQEVCDNSIIPKPELKKLNYIRKILTSGTFNAELVELQRNADIILFNLIQKEYTKLHIGDSFYKYTPYFIVAPCYNGRQSIYTAISFLNNMNSTQQHNTSIFLYFLNSSAIPTGEYVDQWYLTLRENGISVKTIKVFKTKDILDQYLNSEDGFQDLKELMIVNAIDIVREGIEHGDVSEEAMNDFSEFKTMLFK